MKVWGMEIIEIEDVARELEINLENVRYEGNAIAFRAVPLNSKAKYSRRSYSGRRIKALCYHGFRDFIVKLFENGAKRVKTSHGDWNNIDEFKEDLDRLAYLNIGSIIEPKYMIELCECE